MGKTNLYMGADHAGFKLKEKLKKYLNKNFFLTDLGNTKFDPEDDYPVYAARVAKAVSKNKNYIGILICGSGQGICISANKIKGIRAALCENERDAFLARNDDKANILCLQGRYTSLDKSKKIAKKFLETKFGRKERYNRRINEIKNLENFAHKNKK